MSPASPNDSNCCCAGALAIRRDVEIYLAIESDIHHHFAASFVNLGAVVTPTDTTHDKRWCRCAALNAIVVFR